MRAVEQGREAMKGRKERKGCVGLETGMRKKPRS